MNNWLQKTGKGLRTSDGANTHGRGMAAWGHFFFSKTEKEEECNFKPCWLVHCFVGNMHTDRMLRILLLSLNWQKVSKKIVQSWFLATHSACHWALVLFGPNIYLSPHITSSSVSGTEAAAPQPSFFLSFCTCFSFSLLGEERTHGVQNTLLSFSRAC